MIDIAILTSFNRNFRARNDGNRSTMNFLASPTIVTAMIFSGKLSFNPTTDSIRLSSGEEFKFSPPVGQDLPLAGFAKGNPAYYPAPSPNPQPNIEVIIKGDSQRLEALKPFTSHFGEGSNNTRGLEFPPLKVLMRVRGKCTTDHISAAVRHLPQLSPVLSFNSLSGSMVKIQRPPNKHIRESSYVLII